MKVRALASAVLAACCLAGAAAAEVQLKAVSAFPESSIFSVNFERLIDKVNADGAGILRLQYIGGGGKVMNPFELGNALRTGVVDIANLPGAYYTNLMPEADALKMIAEPLRDIRPGPLWDLLDRLHRDKMNAVFLGRHKSHVPFHLYLARPIDGMDLSGLKIRVTPIYRAFFAALGADVVQTPPGEVYTALERGVVDGYGWPLQGIFDMGWQEVTRFRVDPGFYGGGVEVLVNLDAWNRLDDAQRSLLLDGARWMEETGDAVDEALNRAEANRQEQEGIQVIRLDGSDAERYLETADEAAWRSIVEISPEHGPELRRLAGGVR